MNNKYVRYIFKVVLLGAAYFLAAYCGESLGGSGYATPPLWPPAGIALAALLLFGSQLWPGITIGSTLFGIFLGVPPLAIISVAVGNTIISLLSTYVLKKIKFDNALARMRDVAALVILPQVIGAAIPPFIGAGNQLLTGEVSLRTFFSTGVSWWVGDFLGVVIAAPIILVWTTQFRRGFDSKRLRLREMIFTDIALVIFCILIFSKLFEPSLEPSTSAYLIFPPLIWIALRFGQLGSVLAVFLVAVVVTLCMVLGLSSVPSGDLSQTLVLTQRFLGITAVTFMFIAAIIEEQHLAEERSRELLKQTVLLDKERAHLRRVNLAKDEFIAVASHQLRTPATGIKINLGMLRENYAGELPVRIKQRVDAAYQFNERQIKVIDDLLGVARLDMENVVLKKEDTDLTRLVDQVIHHLDSTLAERQQTISFVHDDKQHVSKVDRTKIAMVLENLIDNASKYSPSGKSIEVELNKTGNRETIEVRDQGVGIASKDINKLFKKFSRVDNALSVERGGTGLGLYWVKKVIRLHGGRISVSSRLGQGTVFTIKL